jgi:hypothetical protein
MAKRHKRRARERRENLLLALGSMCAWCGELKNLTFDCIMDCGDLHHKYDTSQRMCFYYRQHREGNLQILCAVCNGFKAQWEKANREDKELNPF